MMLSALATMASSFVIAIGFSSLAMIARAVADQRAGLVDVFGPLHERQRDPVGAELEAVLEVAAVLGGERGERNDLVGDVDALALGELAAHLDAGHRVAVAAALDLEAQLAVVEQELQAGLQHGEDFGMRQADALRGARRGIEVEPQRRAFVEQ